MSLGRREKSHQWNDIENYHLSLFRCGNNIFARTKLTNIEAQRCVCVDTEMKQQQQQQYQVHECCYNNIESNDIQFHFQCEMLPKQANMFHDWWRANTDRVSKTSISSSHLYFIHDLCVNACDRVIFVYNIMGRDEEMKSAHLCMFYI